MDILLTVPSDFARHIKRNKRNFSGITMAMSDPDGQKLGSGGGTVNVLWQNGFVPGRKENRTLNSLDRPKRIIIHSDGQSRRLPAYAPSGKSFIPFPVFKWSRGQRIDQTLFDIQKPLLETILSKAPEGVNTMVASGDALVWTDAFTGNIPMADVVCVGIWTQPEVASRHGVFVCQRHDPTELHHMLQKPTLEELQGLTGDFLYLLDAGIWLLSDRAVNQLFKNAGWNERKRSFTNGIPGSFDLYTDFGRQIGNQENGNQALTVRILPIDHADFYHFGSNADLLRSCGTLQNRITDQREIWHKKIKPGPDIFVQNAVTRIPFNTGHSSVWIENSFIPETWTLHDHHIITGIPENSWRLEIPAGVCLDFVPVDTHAWCIRVYGFYDSFRGSISDKRTSWLNCPAKNWFTDRSFTDEEINMFSVKDIYDSAIFPVLDEKQITGAFLRWIIGRPGILNETSNILDGKDDPVKSVWLKVKRLSARELIQRTNHLRLSAMRRRNMEGSLPALAKNHRQSIFYQLDLDQLARQFRKAGLALPEPLEPEAGAITQIHDLMFRSAYLEKHSKSEAQALEQMAFIRLREGMLAEVQYKKQDPVLNVQHDQILWGRSPLRLDLAGGWTDTPPYCILYGGRVVNMAVELNGQPPIQVYIRPTGKPWIVVHSIDLGVQEVIRKYSDLTGVSAVGSAFSIPKAALMLAGFHPGYSAHPYKNLQEQLHAFGGGFDISLMVAVPKGSGLGTSSILASTLLGGLSEFGGLAWDRHEVAYRTLLLEQLLTTGGGWQDQLGGIFEGVKLIESTPGLIQKPSVRWAPDHLFSRPESKTLMLLYYTGITRVAKHILKDIVRGMFLNSALHLDILSAMKHHARNSYESIQNHDWEGLAAAIRYSWELNQRFDAGTNPPEIAHILDSIGDYMVSCKLLGAGGGGYLLIIAKDLQAANLIRSKLQSHPPNPRARFVNWELSTSGMELTKS